MALVHMKDMLKHAYDNGYAVGSINVISLERDFTNRLLATISDDRMVMLSQSLETIALGNDGLLKAGNW